MALAQISSVELTADSSCLESDHQAREIFAVRPWLDPFSGVCSPDYEGEYSNRWSVFLLLPRNHDLNFVHQICSFFSNAFWSTMISVNGARVCVVSSQDAGAVEHEPIYARCTVNVIMRFVSLD
jgi:hypothetical protein